MSQFEDFEGAVFKPAPSPLSPMYLPFHLERTEEALIWWLRRLAGLVARALAALRPGRVHHPADSALQYPHKRMAGDGCTVARVAAGVSLLGIKVPGISGVMAPPIRQRQSRGQ